MKRAFADTFYWIALISNKDSFHDAVLAYTSTMSADTVVYTTDEVLTELLASCAADPRLRSDGGRVVQGLLVQTDMRIIPQSRAGFMAGFDLYLARPDKACSLVDCISIEVMRREGLTHVMRLARSPRRARRIVFFLDKDLSWMSGTRTKVAKTTRDHPTD